MITAVCVLGVSQIWMSEIANTNMALQPEAPGGNQLKLGGHFPHKKNIF